MCYNDCMNGGAALPLIIMPKDNAELLKNYLQGAKALEWDKYTIQQLRSGISSKIAAYTKKRSDALNSAERLKSESNSLQNKIDSYRRSSYIESGRYKISIVPEGSMYLVAVLIWGVITAAGIWLGEGKGLKAFLLPFRIEQFFARLTGPFLGVIIHFLVLPGILYLLILLLSELRRRSKYESKQAENRNAFDSSQKEQEKKIKQEWADSIKQNRERISVLTGEADDIGSIILPELNEELQRNTAALSRAESALKKYYDPGILHSKYQGLIPVTTICEYREAGRCSSLAGHEGAYNLYESEYRLNMINAKLNTIQEQLKHISQQNQAIQSYIRSIDSTVGSLISSVDDCTDQNLKYASAIRSGTAQIAQSAQLQSFYDRSSNASLRHLDYMASIEYYSKHIF